VPAVSADFSFLGSFATISWSFFASLWQAMQPVSEADPEERFVKAKTAATPAGKTNPHIFFIAPPEFVVQQARVHSSRIFPDTMGRPHGRLNGMCKTGSISKSY
jgi:hypothetical protein